MDISNLKVKELRTLIERASARITEIERDEAQAMKNHLIALARDAGYDAVQLITGKASAGSGKAKRSVKAKYKHPSDGRTWAGRGRKPLWVVELLAKGKTLESLAI
jgi:DNA-binding protein H-NS